MVAAGFNLGFNPRTTRKPVFCVAERGSEGSRGLQSTEGSNVVTRRGATAEPPSCLTVQASLCDQVGAFIGVLLRPRRVHSGVESPDCDCCLSFKACQKEGTFARHSGRTTVRAS